jgi:hypothetical protein
MQQEAMLPLTAPDASLCEPTGLASHLQRIPVVGCIFSGFAHYERVLRMTRLLEVQLIRRACFPTEEWESTGHDPQAAEKLARAIVTRLPWPNYYFLPSDALDLVLLDGDSMGAFEASFAIKKELGINILPGSISRLGSFCDLVAQVYGSPAAA